MDTPFSKLVELLEDDLTFQTLLSKYMLHNSIAYSQAFYALELLLIELEEKDLLLAKENPKMFAMSYLAMK